MPKIKSICKSINLTFDRIERLNIKRDEFNKVITIKELTQSIKSKNLVKNIRPLIVQAIVLYNKEPFDDLLINTGINPDFNMLNISLGRYGTKPKIQIYVYPESVVYKGEAGVSQIDSITPLHSFEITQRLRPILHELLGDSNEVLELGELSLNKFYYYQDVRIIK